MRLKTWIAAVALVLVSALKVSAGSMLLLGAGSATAAVTYVGPGDVVAGAKGAWLLRCFTAAYAGNVADVYAPADASHTLVTCSAGGILNETLQALSVTCASSCTVKTLYDQSGNGHDAVQASSGFRPSLILNCLNTTKPCMAFIKANSQQLIATAVGATSQPWTFSAVANRTGSTTSFQGIIADATGGFGPGYNNSVNSIITYANGILPQTGADNAWHAILSVGNNASSIISVDGSSVTGAASTGTLAANITIGLGLSFLDGRIAETILWGGDQSGSNTALCHNEFAYWGTAASC